MSTFQTRRIIVGAIIGAILGLIVAIALWLGAASLTHASASQMSQWPLGVIVLCFTCAPLGAATGAGIGLARSGKDREAGWIFLVLAFSVASLTAFPSVDLAIRAAAAGRPTHDILVTAALGGGLALPFLATGAALLRRASELR